MFLGNLDLQMICSQSVSILPWNCDVYVDLAVYFDFDTVELSWKGLGSWAPAFDGCGHFDHDLCVFVGLSKEPDTVSQLCFCYMPINDINPMHFGNSRHVSATLVYIGMRESVPNKFSLVQCIFIEDDNTGQQLKIVGHNSGPGQELKNGGDNSIGHEFKEKGRFLYRFTTFGLYPDE
ncbi:hypothetical protein ZWY2020_003290 [Hordeum vulgare]|nr:hypothetical protein ZWY2020_003290 [Hordeum vulgare]